ncbi:MAG: hybrid sensor histidine kinase/response regulator, partial [Gloeocapsa sp. DLM2.Bin57]
KEKAISKGLISKEKAKNMVNQEVYELLFHPGFTTKDKADDFSGRGVGLDVVRTNLQPIRGTVSIDSTLGKGTNFTIRLPLTLSICKALPCLSNNARIAFPIDGVEDTKDYRPEDIKINDQGQKCILWSGQLLPYLPLNSLLSYNRQISRSTIYGGQEYDDTISIVVLRGAGSLLAIQVDKIFPEQEIVIKQIEGPIPKPAGIAGATVLGDGRIMPIGDVMELIEIAQGRRSIDHNLVSDTTYSPQVPKLPQTTEPVVLIVDDSITVRQLLSLTFNKAGYRVEEARDGQEAWEKLRSGLPCDLVFCDIEMPRMNGLKLLSMMQQDPKLRDTPVALLTSRGAEKHRKVAAELGASGYLTKPCTDKDLLDSAQRMIAGEKLMGKRVSASSSSVTQSGQKVEMTALIIDDSVVVREMLSMTFKKSGYRVEQARDGQEAWEKLRSGLPCNIIFCDIEMPRMNGLELLSRLQEDNQLSAIPVAMITSRGAERHRKIAAELGAKAYFTKPYIEEELLDAAKRMIQGEVFLKESETV